MIKVCLKNDNLSFCEKDSELVPIILDHFKKICERKWLRKHNWQPLFKKLWSDDKNNLVITTFGRKIGETEIKEIDLKSLDSYIENVKKKIESYSIVLVQSHLC